MAVKVRYGRGARLGYSVSTSNCRQRWAEPYTMTTKPGPEKDVPVAVEAEPTGDNEIRYDTYLQLENC